MNCIDVKIENISYNLYINNGLINNIGKILSNLYFHRKIVVITDSIVKTLYFSELYDSLNNEGYEVKVITVAPGEQSKSFTDLNKIYSDLCTYNINRNNLIIALGGGVVGDLAGFAASTYLRGIPYVQIPTTLLSQVDSSIGGKVAINLDYGKNLIGSFYHPKAVFIDPLTLNTLSDRSLSDGMAEVIKYGAIKSTKLFDMLYNISDRQSLMKIIEQVIHMCCLIKRDIVALDEKDTNVRMHLNFGHTLGHAIEKYYDYSLYSHGEAISIGMSAFTRNSELLGLTAKDTSSKLTELLSGFSLPTKLPNVDINEIINIIRYDKKASDDFISIVLLNELGSSYLYNTNYSEIVNFIL